MNKSLTIPVVLGFLLLAGCDQASEQSEQKTNAAQSPQVEVPPRNSDFQQIVRGARIFQQNCATCHGKLAQGAPNWRQPDKNGKYPPPPLNGDGHTWHHPMNVLVSTIKNGTKPLGGSMPAWGDKLSEQDIQDVLAWVQAQWPDEIYARWYLNNQGKQ